ncbi:hypothetical protein H1O16_gp441 [Burkholderia phage BcepSaruman]|uniref:Uncharacterized protein n=1 Tax=Burkholderia phage BcepSaruman TaxID=2530032 RepID=A0A4D5ZD10_9CAUD|nr:hypothetical protein H1O16_gp441 [Burkholderia phage BcepSaruman]QBX06854.1 hypothetical protein BcepSaruman_441 [Burkholderia phage BcepSaruman]
MVMQRRYLNEDQMQILELVAHKLEESGVVDHGDEYLCLTVEDIARRSDCEYRNQAAIELVDMIEGSLVDAHGRGHTMCSWVYHQFGKPTAGRNENGCIVDREAHRELCRRLDRHSNQCRLGWVHTMIQRGYIEWEDHHVA